MNEELAQGRAGATATRESVVRPGQIPLYRRDGSVQAHALVDSDES